MNFQDVLTALDEFWSQQGCALRQPYDLEKGAGTMNPVTFFGSLDPAPRSVAYPEPSRRPADGRYGENPLRLYRHWQYQVVIKPSPEDIQETYLESLRHLGVDFRSHDVRFVEDNWEAPTLGAWGLGWEVWIDGTEITQFTYFQQVGGRDLVLIPVEMTYGLERLCCFLQGVTDIFDVQWNEDLTYGDIYRSEEYEHSRYSFEVADVAMLLRSFTDCESEAVRALETELLAPAYDYVLRCSHLFNLLDARGALSVTERTSYIGRIRDLSRRCADLYLARHCSGDRGVEMT